MNNNFVTYPRQTKEFADIETLIKTYVLPNYQSIEPVFSKDSLIITQGSCFARNIAESLGAYNVEVMHHNINEVINTTYANCKFFQYVSNAEKYLNEQEIQFFDQLISKDKAFEFCDGIKKANVFILTIGVAPCWFEKNTNNIVLNIDKRNISEYDFRNTSPEWNSQNIEEIIKIIKAMNEKINIVLTLSPAPLNRSFEYESAMVADCVSKSILRVAIDDVMSQAIDNVNYWPSFEMVRWVGAHIGTVYGNDDGHPRHVSKKLVDTVTGLFISAYGDNSLEKLGESVDFNNTTAFSLSK